MVLLAFALMIKAGSPAPRGDRDAVAFNGVAGATDRSPCNNAEAPRIGSLGIGEYATSTVPAKTWFHLTTRVGR